MAFGLGPDQIGGAFWQVGDLVRTLDGDLVATILQRNSDGEQDRSAGSDGEDGRGG